MVYAAIKPVLLMRLVSAKSVFTRVASLLCVPGPSASHTSLVTCGLGQLFHPRGDFPDHNHWGLLILYMEDSPKRVGILGKQPQHLRSVGIGRGSDSTLYNFLSINQPNEGVYLRDPGLCSSEG